MVVYIGFAAYVAWIFQSMCLESDFLIEWTGGRCSTSKFAVQRVKVAVSAAYDPTVQVVTLQDVPMLGVPEIEAG